MKQSRTFAHVYRRGYGIVLRRVGSLIAHAGPLTPALLKLGYHLHQRLVPRSIDATVLNPLLVDGLRVYHDGHPLLARGLAMGWYEPDVVRLLKDRVRPGMTVLDVGANIGYFSLLCARLVGESGMVWAFEPAPHVFELLVKGVSDNAFESRVQAVPQAVGRVIATTHLYVNTTEHLLSSVYQEASRHHVWEPSGQYQCVEVPCTTLDAWAADHGWPHVDLVKIDIEGGEKPALDGMVELSRANPHLQLIVEFNARTLGVAGVTATAFFETLHACGFNRISVIDQRLRLLHLPADITWLERELPRRRVECVNLLCEKSAV